jgi:uncharacterized membrane protein
VIHDLLLVATLLTALGCGVVAGFFYAFSVCVMKSLARLPPPQGIAAMNHINVVVINPWFMGAFMGTALVCSLVAAAAWAREAPGAPWVLFAAVLYLAGTIGVTMAFNVPLNNALAKANPDTADGARLWADYLVTWTRWNHVRTIAALAAAALLGFVLTLPAAGATT